MRSTSKAILLGLSALLTVTLLSLQQPDAPAGQVTKQVIRQADSLYRAVKRLQAIPADAANSAELQAFRQVRLAYKRMEWAAEYFDPLTARQVNGPPVPETELTGQVIMPNGLQVIEQDIFPHLTVTKRPALISLIGNLVTNVAEFRSFFKEAELQDWQILDAVKLEVFRVETLGLNDFDDPQLKNCFAESATALQSLRDVTRHYGDVVEFKPAIQYLRRPATFNNFDRAAFITQYANPLTRSLTALHAQLNLANVRYNRLLNQDAATLFDKNAFNRSAFTASPGDSATTEKIALGKRLFFDSILSGNGKRSCASCHQPEKAFTDGLVKNLDITGQKMIARNTPTLVNAALQPAQFYDLRAPSLEDQSIDVMQNRDEMHGDMQVAINRLWRDSSYRRQFSTTYPQQKRAAIDTFEVMNALASYVRSLTALNSRFDAYMQSDTKAMSTSEIKGFNLFMGKARCSTCHYLPLFNGALPPRYMQMEAEVIGVPQTKTGKRIDPDLGLYALSPFNFNKYAFKTTTVRNAARTAPYMHNGVFTSLAEVVDFYDKGGAAGTGIKIPNQTLDATPLQLTEVEKAELIAFMESLNSH